MLRRAVTGSLLVVMTVISGLAVVAAPAFAQVTVVCAERDPATGVCRVELTVNLAGDPPAATATVSGGSGAPVMCHRGPHYLPRHGPVRQVDCQTTLGWYSQTYDCYFTRDGSKSATDDGVILPAGYQDGDDGSVYAAMCFTANHQDIPSAHFCFDVDCLYPDWVDPVPHMVFLPAPPDGYEDVPPDPVPELLVTAISELMLMAPAIGTAPPAGQGSALVRLPVWLWNDVSDNNWGTLETAAGPIADVSLELSARADGIVWDMGDGETQPCQEGAAFQAGMDVFDPPCGHTYQKASRDRPGGVYQIDATTTWVLEWTTQGWQPDERGDQFEFALTATTELVVSELQVLTRNPR